MKNNELPKLTGVYYAKIKTCQDDEMIIRISDIEMVISQGDICLLKLKGVSSPVKLKNKLSEIEYLLNMINRIVIPCSVEP